MTSTIAKFPAQPNFHAGLGWVIVLSWIDIGLLVVNLILPPYIGVLMANWHLHYIQVLRTDCLSNCWGIGWSYCGQIGITCTWLPQYWHRLNLLHTSRWGDIHNYMQVVLRTDCRSNGWGIGWRYCRCVLIKNRLAETDCHYPPSSSSGK